MNDGIAQKICAARLISVVVFEEQKEVVPTVEALLEGGVQCLELVLRSPYALRAATLVKQKYPQILLGIGTVIAPQQVEQIAGIADFAVAPGVNRRVIESALSVGLPFYPGIVTPSEIETALEYDIRLLKYFPAEPVGSLDYLKAVNAPYAHLGLRYVPLGGVNPQNLANYLQSPLVAAVGGSWLAPRRLIATADWNQIRARAKQAVTCGQ